jgi:hypothetical protein
MKRIREAHFREVGLQVSDDQFGRSEWKERCRLSELMDEIGQLMNA